MTPTHPMKKLLGLPVLAAAFVLAGANPAAAQDVKVSDVCGETLLENTDVKDPTADTFSGNCVITVDDEVKLVIDGVGFTTIEGDLIISGADKAELVITASTIVVDGDFIIDFANGDIDFNNNSGSVGGDFRVESAGLGDVDVNDNFGSAFAVAGDLTITTVDGDVDVNNNDFGSASPSDTTVKATGLGTCVVNGNIPTLVCE